MSDSLTLHTGFTPVYQEAIIGHMMNDYIFLVKCCSELKYSWFQNADVGFIFKTISAYYEKYRRPPKKEEIDQELYSAKVSVVKEYNLLRDKFSSCILSAGQIRIDILYSELSGWVRQVLLHEMILKTVDIVNNSKTPNKTENAINYLSTEIKKVNQIDFENMKHETWGNVKEFYKVRSKDLIGCQTIGHPLFDEMMRPGGAGGNEWASIATASDPYGYKVARSSVGGLVRGDSTIIIGPVNSGKTTTVISIIMANIVRGNRVLYITHEQKPDDIKNKVYNCIYGKTQEDILLLDNDFTESVAAEINKNLQYISWIKNGKMYCEDVIAEIVKMQESLMAKTGKGYDLLVVDYPGKTRSRNSGKDRSKWEDMDEVYDQYINLCQEYGFHGIFPAQTNREGYKIVRGTDTGRLVDMGDVGGSFSIVQKADNVITINRFTIAPSSDGNPRTVIVYNQVKSRSSSTGKKFASIADLRVSRSHGFGLNFKELSETFNVTPETLTQAFFPNASNLERSEIFMNQSGLLPPQEKPPTIS